MSYSTTGYSVKMEYGSKNNIFGLKMMVKSGVEIVILKFIYAQTLSDPFIYFIIGRICASNNKFSNKKDFQ